MGELNFGAEIRAIQLLCKLMLVDYCSKTFLRYIKGSYSQLSISKCIDVLYTSISRAYQSLLTMAQSKVCSA